ncbi:MAG: hypothetical protein U0871_07205 [Gemmataceae bacterium]
MPKIFRPTFKDKHTGQTRTTRYWYAWINGRRVPLKTTDKRVAERKAVELERAAELGHDPGLLDKARRTPVSAHLTDFEESLRAKGCSEAHVGILIGRLRKLFDGCRITALADATAGVVKAWLARRQRDGAMSAQTRKHYAVHARQFGRWLAAEGKVARNPFAGLKTNLKVENDRRRRRRALTPEECQRLLAAAAASKRKLGGMSGPDRRVFYLVAPRRG